MKTIALTYGLLLFSLMAFTQNTPGLTFGGFKNEKASSMCRTAEGGFLLAGSTRSYGQGSEDNYLIKLNAYGNLIWSGTYGDNHQDFARDIIPTTNGYLILGDRWKEGWRRTNVNLHKINTLGEELWKVSLGTLLDEKGFKILETSDNHLLIVGYSRGFDDPGDFYIVKTDAVGDTIWEYHYGYDLDDYGMDVIEKNDGSFIIVGTKDGFFDDVHQNYLRSNADILLLSIDNHGNELWRHLLGGSEHDFGNAIHHAPGGGYYIFGSSQSFGAGSFDMFLAKFDTNDQLEWHKTYGGEKYEYGMSMDISSSGDLYLFGSTKSFGEAGSVDFYLVKTDAEGTAIWDITIGGDDIDLGNKILATADSGCAVLGSSLSYGNGGYDFLFVKVDSDGFIENLFTGTESNFFNQALIAPNPVHDKGRIILDANNSEFVRIMELTSINGFFTRKIKVFGPDFSFDVGDLAAGTYIYKIYSSNNTTQVLRGKLVVY